MQMYFNDYDHGKKKVKSLKKSNNLLPLHFAPTKIKRQREEKKKKIQQNQKNEKKRVKKSMKGKKKKKAFIVKSNLAPR